MDQIQMGNQKEDEIPADKAKVPDYYCGKCHTLKMNKPYHCNDCDICIDEYDHHCPWVGKVTLLINIYIILRFLQYNHIYLAH